MIFCLTSNVYICDTQIIAHKTCHFHFQHSKCIYGYALNRSRNTENHQLNIWCGSRSAHLSFPADLPLNTIHDTFREFREKKSRDQNRKTHNAAWVLVFMRFYFICFTLKSFNFLNGKLVFFLLLYLTFFLSIALNGTKCAAVVH